MSAARILVVDDEPQIRRIMRTTLTGAGYEVDDAKTGEEGLVKVRSFRPDLVLFNGGLFESPVLAPGASRSVRCV